MPIDFPSSPTTNQTYTYLGRVYTYNGSAWDLTYTSANVITNVAGVTSGNVSNIQIAAAATAGGISSDESLIYPMLLGGM